MKAVFIELPVFQRYREQYMDDASFCTFQELFTCWHVAVRNTGKNVMTKRNLFAGLAEGFDALTAERQGKVTLRRHHVELAPAPETT